MTATPLLDWLERRYPSSPGFKSPGPSQEAGEAIAGRAAILREDCARALSTGPMTADECARRLDESVLSIRPRFSELLRANRIEDTGERRKNTSGRNATVWRAL